MTLPDEAHPRPGGTGEDASLRARMAPAGTGYRLVAWVFLRALALIYLAAFASLAVQIQAIAGSDGLFPLQEQLRAAADAHGLSSVLAYPSLFWLAAGDWALALVAWGGCARPGRPSSGNC